MSEKLGKNGLVEIDDEGNLSATNLEGDNTGDEDLSLYVKIAFSQKSANYTLTSSDSILEATANTFTFALPTAVGISGKQYVIKNSGTGVVTIDGYGSQTIDGEITQTINQYDSITIVSNNTNWIII